MYVSLPRTIKIGKHTVGLIGLDTALHRIRNHPEMPLEKAVAQAYTEVAVHNYIPATAADTYQKAIENEIILLREGGQKHDDDLVIRILGPGCVSCNNLQKMVIETLVGMKVAADVFQVHDPDEIGRFGVMLTPALVINGEVKCAGRLPTRAQVEMWIRELMD